MSGGTEGPRDLHDALTSLGAEVLGVLEIPSVPHVSGMLESPASVRFEFRLAGGVHSVRSYAPRGASGMGQSLVLSGHDSLRSPGELTLHCKSGSYTYLRPPGDDTALDTVLAIATDHLASAHEGSSTRTVSNAALARLVAAVRLTRADEWPAPDASALSASGTRRDLLSHVASALSLLEGVSGESYALAARFLEARAEGAPEEWLLRHADARGSDR